MGISTGQFSRPAKFSTIIADADLDIGARAILSTDLSIYQGSAAYWVMKNRAKIIERDLVIRSFTASGVIGGDIVNEKFGSNNGVTVDGLLIKDDAMRGVIKKPDAIDAVCYSKVASANVRHSHDAEIHDERADGSTWLLGKTITLTDGIKGTLRFTLQAKGENASVDNKVIWAKNSKAADLGVEFVPANVAYQADSQDVNVGTMAAGETIEIWTQCDDWQGIFVKECRISYDNDADAVVVASANS